MCVCVCVCAGGSQTSQEILPSCYQSSASGTGTRTSKEDIVRRNLLESVNSVATETISSNESPSAVAASSKQAGSTSSHATHAPIFILTRWQSPDRPVKHGVHLVTMGYHGPPTPVRQGFKTSGGNGKEARAAGPDAAGGILLYRNNEGVLLWVPRQLHRTLSCFY